MHVVDAFDRVEVAYDDGKNVIVRRDNSFVYMRRGPMSLEALELLTATWRSMRRADATEIGGLFVLEASAPLAAPAVRLKQRELLQEMNRDGRLRSVLVIEGSGVEAMAKRSVARLLALGSRVEIVSELEAGVVAMSRMIAVGEEPLRAMATEARARLDRGAGSAPVR